MPDNSELEKQSFMLKSLIERFKDNIHQLYGDFLVSLILFGSHSRGDATMDSDIDFLIVTDQKLAVEKRKKLIDFISDTSINEGILINFIEMSPQRFKSESSPLLMNIRRDGIVL